MRFSPNSVTLSANLLIVLAYALMHSFASQRLFLLSQRLPVRDGHCLLPNFGWQRSAHASWARGRLNATSSRSRRGQWCWGVIWGFAASIAGVSYTLLGAAVLFLASLLLAARLFDQQNTQRPIIIASYTAGIRVYAAFRFISQ